MNIDFKHLSNFSEYILLIGILFLGAKSCIFNINYASAQNLTISPFESPRNLPEFSFAAVGDMGCSSVAKKIISDSNKKLPSLIIALGDLSYQDRSADCWFKLISPIDNKTKIALGDQDYRSDFLLNQYKNHFNLSQEYYSFDYKNVHFIALATESSFDSNSPQYTFVKHDLESASKNPDIKWIIVYSYRPQYSSPSIHPGNTQLRDQFHPLFQKYNVDIVLQAHNHNYQRTYPIKYNLNESSKPILEDTNTRYYHDPIGQIYVTVGTGGSALHDLNGKESYVAAQYRGFGFLDVLITSNSRNLTGTFFDISGSIEDRFTVVK